MSCVGVNACVGMYVDELWGVGYDFVCIGVCVGVCGCVYYKCVCICTSVQVLELVMEVLKCFNPESEDARLVCYRTNAESNMCMC